MDDVNTKFYAKTQNESCISHTVICIVLHFNHKSVAYLVGNLYVYMYR